jgi:hypothetical protein
MTANLSLAVTIGRALLTPLPIGARVKLCGIRIESPPNNSRVPSRTFVVSGRYRRTLGLRFVVLHQQGKKYWPQGSPEFDPTHKRWEKQVTISEAGPGTSSSIIVAAVSDDLWTSISYYGQVHDKTGEWVPIESAAAPRGLTEAARIVLTHVGR